MTQQDQGPSGHRRVYLNSRSWQGLEQRLAAVAVSALDRTQKDVECDWERHRLTKKRVQVRSERESDRSQHPPLSLNNQHWRHNKSQRLHHPVLLCRSRHIVLRTSSWIQERRERKGARQSVTRSSEISERLMHRCSFHSGFVQ